MDHMNAFDRRLSLWKRFKSGTRISITLFFSVEVQSMLHPRVMITPRNGIETNDKFIYAQ